MFLFLLLGGFGRAASFARASPVLHSRRAIRSSTAVPFGKRRYVRFYPSRGASASMRFAEGDAPFLSRRVRFYALRGRRCAFPLAAVGDTRPWETHGRVSLPRLVAQK
jgi:hypothetical protein